MKSNILISIKDRLYICLLSIFVLLASCSEDAKFEDNYINLSGNSFSFMADGEAIEIKVQSFPAWNVSVDGDWITIDKQDEGSVRISANKNYNAESRQGKLIFTAGDVIEIVELSQITEYINPLYSTLPDNFRYAVMSHSGTFIGGYLVDNIKGEYTPVIMNTSTKESYVCGPVRYEAPMPVAVSDDGTIMISQTINAGEPGYYKDGAYHRYEAPAGATVGNVLCASADCSVVAGFIRVNTWLRKPAKWVNGVPELLPSPEKDATGKSDLTSTQQIAMVRGCSPDGSVLIGESLTDNTHTGLYWKNGEVKYISQDMIKKVIVTVDTPWGLIESPVVDRSSIAADTQHAISNNGKYIAFDFKQYKELSDGTKASVSLPGIYNIETGKTTLLTDIPGGTDMQAVGLTVSEDGRFMSFVTLKNSIYDQGYIHDFTASKSQTTSEYLKSSLGITLEVPTAMIRKFCLGGKVLFGGTVVETANQYVLNPWFVTIPTDWVQE